MGSKKKKKLKVALVYNGDEGTTPEKPEDRGSSSDLIRFVRHIARTLRSLGHHVTVMALKRDLFSFQRRLMNLNPDVVFNQYEDVIHGALYEMRLAATVRMMGFPLTGSPALALGLCRYKFMAASILQGAGVPLPPQTELVERVSDLDRGSWTFPLIVQPSQEHAGIGLDRDSVVKSKKMLKEKVRYILKEFHQPALVQAFLPGREFNVGIIGGRRMRVLPLAEVDYGGLPEEIPPIMSYAAKFIETSEEYKGTRVLCPAPVEPELAREISVIALRAFRVLGSWGYGRVDIRLDAEGRPKVLEVNCNPDLEEGVALARSAAAAGIEYPRLLQTVIDSALERQPFEVDIPMIPPPPPERTMPLAQGLLF